MYEKERAAMTCRIMQSHASSELIITLQHIQHAQIKTEQGFPKHSVVSQLMFMFFFFWVQDHVHV